MAAFFCFGEVYRDVVDVGGVARVLFCDRCSDGVAVRNFLHMMSILSCQLVVVALLFFTAAANAGTYPAVTGYYPKGQSSQVLYPTIQAACDSIKLSFPNERFVFEGLYQNNNQKFPLCSQYIGDHRSGYVDVYTGSYCANGGTRNGAVCEKSCEVGETLMIDGQCGCPDGSYKIDGKCGVCESGSSLLNGKCVSDKCPDGSARPFGGLCRGKACSGETYNPQSPGPDYSVTSTCSDQGCKFDWWKNSDNTHSVQYNSLGECNPDAPPDPDCKPGFITQTVAGVKKCYPTENTCASKGQCSGTVNGVAICVPCSPGTTTTTPPSGSNPGGTTTVNPDGSTTTTSPGGGTTDVTNTRTNPDGSTTTTHGSGSTTTQTTCTNGVCRTVEVSTTNNPDGSSDTTTRQTEEDQGTFCAKNPTATVCKEKEETFTAPGVGKFTSKNPEIVAAQAELDQYIAGVRSQLSTLVGSIAQGGGGLPCPPAINVLGSQFQLCAAGFEDKLSAVPLVVLFICSLISVYILLK